MTDTPRIAWLSPYGPRSDIGAFTRSILPHFARGERFDCDLFVNACGPTYDAPMPAMEIPKSGAIGEILSRYDAAFFNLGNNVQNHREIVEALRRVPGVAILHDFSYHHFFAHKCFEELRSPPAYARLMRDYYGSAGFNMALRSGVITRDATLYAPWDGENVADYPLMQPLVELAAAVIVHSRFMEERVAKFFKGPVLRLFLPSDQKMAPTPEDLGRWRETTARKEQCHFATFGHIGRPKCLDTVVQAMAQSPTLKARAHLTIAGHPGDKEYVREIEAMVLKLGLSKQVTFEYGVTNERLLAIKNDSDAFLNLRFPNTEGASGSLIEMMNAGKPVIAYRAGSYADIPAGCALLVERTDGIDAVVAAMEEILLDPARRIAIGEAARAHIRDLDSESYVRQLKAFTTEIGPVLRRRAGFVAPVRDALSWRAEDVAAEDADWFADLSHGRRSFFLLERDSQARSPEIFLDWSMDDLVTFTSRVLLHAPGRSGLNGLLVDYAQRLGRWSFWQLISRLCLYQTLCEKQELTKEDVTEYGDRVADMAFWDIATQLQPEIFVRLLYLCVLGRAWGGTELENWIRRIRQGMEPAAALLEFAGSQEYRQTFPDTLMGDVEDWARQEVAVSAGGRGKPGAATTVWPADKDIRFNEDNKTTESILGGLWHRRDAQGRWSNGRTGDLRFQAPEEALQTGATLSLRLRVTGTRITGERKLVARSNRLELAATVLRNDAPQTLVIPLPPALLGKDGVHLVLMVDRDFSPAASGQSADKRSLGVMLIEGRLTVNAAAMEEAPP
jgi:glycosyltransferase involved in cell wall biosynthesis